MYRIYFNIISFPHQICGAELADAADVARHRALHAEVEKARRAFQVMIMGSSSAEGKNTRRCGNRFDSFTT